MLLASYGAIILWCCHLDPIPTDTVPSWWHLNHCYTVTRGRLTAVCSGSWPMYSSHSLPLRRASPCAISFKT